MPTLTQCRLLGDVLTKYINELFCMNERFARQRSLQTLHMLRKESWWIS